MTISKPMEWEIWTLAQVAELPIEARADPSTCTKLINAVEHGVPLDVYDGSVVLRLACVDGVWTGDHQIARAIKAMVHAGSRLWFELRGGGDCEPEHGEVLREPSPTSARALALAGGAVLQREERRLKVEGYVRLVPVLRHFVQRWQDYRIPVWKRS